MSAHPNKKTRSRNGCFTCRVRKVRCSNAELPAGLSPASSTRDRLCGNCERLGLECRWTVPAEGEQYTPPPKRRRTQTPSHNRHDHVESRCSLLNAERAQTDQHEETGQTSASNTSVVTSGDKPNNRSSLPADSRARADDTVDSVTQPPGSVEQPLHISLQDPLLGIDFDHLDTDLMLDGLDFMLPTTMASPFLVHDSEGREASATEQGLAAASQSQVPIPWSEAGDANMDSNRSVTVTDENRHLIQHYIQSLQGYAKVADRPRDSNLYISAFADSLSFPPLFYAILSFSSAHLAMADSTLAAQADMYDRLSHESLESFRHEQTTSIDGLLSAIFVRIKKIHVTAGSVDSFMALMQTAADILLSDRGSAYLAATPALGRRIIIRLAILDARSSSYRLGGGNFVRAVRHLPVLSNIFPERVQLDYAADGILCLLHVALLRLQAADLEDRIHQQMTAEFVTSQPVRVEEVRSLRGLFHAQVRRWEGSMRVGVDDLEHDRVLPGEVPLDATGYRDYTVLSALHSVVLYLYTIFPLPDYPVTRSVSVVLECELMIQSDASRAHSPASLLPASLFLAGLCTGDPIHRDWVLKLLKQGEGWGVYIRKVQELLKEIVRGRRDGVVLDVRSAMERSTGLFVI